MIGSWSLLVYDQSWSLHCCYDSACHGKTDICARTALSLWAVPVRHCPKAKVDLMHGWPVRKQNPLNPCKRLGSLIFPSVCSCLCSDGESAISRCFNSQGNGHIPLLVRVCVNMGLYFLVIQPNVGITTEPAFRLARILVVFHGSFVAGYSSQSYLCDEVHFNL